jgi:hypothetical protein
MKTRVIRSSRDKRKRSSFDPTHGSLSDSTALTTLSETVSQNTQIIQWLDEALAISKFKSPLPDDDQRI